MKFVYRIGLYLAGLILLAILSYSWMQGVWIAILPVSLLLGLFSLPLFSKKFRLIYALPLTLFLLTPVCFLIFSKCNSDNRAKPDTLMRSNNAGRW
jgi:hypothetical protein